MGKVKIIGILTTAILLVSMFIGIKLWLNHNKEQKIKNMGINITKEEKMNKDFVVTFEGDIASTKIDSISFFVDGVSPQYVDTKLEKKIKNGKTYFTLKAELSTLAIYYINEYSEANGNIRISTKDGKVYQKEVFINTSTITDGDLAYINKIERQGIKNAKEAAEGLLLTDLLTSSEDYSGQQFYFEDVKITSVKSSTTVKNQKDPYFYNLKFQVGDNPKFTLRTFGTKEMKNVKKGDIVSIYGTLVGETELGSTKMQESYNLPLFVPIFLVR